MKRLNTIKFQFPCNTTEEADFYNSFIRILELLPNSRINNEQIELSAVFPKKALPITIFKKNKKIDYPCLTLDLKLKDEIVMDNFFIANDNYFLKKKKFVNKNSFSIKGTKPITPQLFYAKFKKHITRIDHTGINIPSRYISKNSFLSIIKGIAKHCNLYKYPINDVWPFILPSNENEFNNDIKRFKFGREPKFEFVYDTYSKHPTIQIDIETKLSRKQVEKLLPKPYGISFDDLADVFRTVYLKHPWSGLFIRLDVRFKNKSKESESHWTTGKWLVESGKRI